MNLEQFKGVKSKYVCEDIDTLKRYKPEKIEEFFDVSCVYLLFDAQGEVLYVGETRNLETRFFRGHKMEGKFHRFSIIKFKDRYGDDWDKRRRQREKLEKALIKKFRPPFNIEHNPDREY